MTPPVRASRQDDRGVAIRRIIGAMREPKLVILDLDWTVWRGNCQNACRPFVRVCVDVCAQEVICA